MSYDIAVWDGRRPVDDAEALAVYRDLFDRYLDGEEQAPPSPRLAAFTEVLLARWPDLTAGTADASPFSSQVRDSAAGPFLHLAVRYSRADEVGDVVARLAAERDLVCFDPQTCRLRPP